MFTGIVQEVGTVEELARRGQRARLRLRVSAALAARLDIGASLAVNGCCLTVTALQPAAHGATLAADLSAETLARTTLGGLRRGARVNLEPPLRAGDPFGGHIVQGHVEAVGRLLESPGGSSRRSAHGAWMRVQIPPWLLPYVIPKGSLAVDGVSLTVAALQGDTAGFALIPFTLTHTNLGNLAAGAPVNLETDPVGHYVERMLAARRPAPVRPALTEKYLREQGF